jgi:hypothetical protein
MWSTAWKQHMPSWLSARGECWPHELGMTRPARRAISDLLPQDVAAAAVEFITGPLLEAP